MHTREKNIRSRRRDLRIFTHPRAPSYPKRRNVSVAHTIEDRWGIIMRVYIYISKRVARSRYGGEAR